MMLKYFVLSGAIMGLIACCNYKKIAKEFPILEMIGLPAFVIGNTLLGFLILPLNTPMIFKYLYLRIKLKLLIIENNRLKKTHNELLKQKEKKLDELNGDKQVT